MTTITITIATAIIIIIIIIISAAYDQNASSCSAKLCSYHSAIMTS